MAEESGFSKFFNLENNPAIKSIGEQFSYDNIFPQGIMGALVGPGSLNTSDDYEGNAASDFLDNLNRKTESYVSSDSDTQGEQLIKSILQGFSDIGEPMLNVLEFPGRKLEEGIEYLQSPSDLRLEEAAKENEIENQRRLSIEGLEPPIGGYQELLDNADELSDLGFIDVTQFDVEKQEKEQAAAEAADKLNLQGPNFVPVAKDKPEPEIDTGDAPPNVEDGFAAAMKDFMTASGKNLPSKNESRSDSIARYKKEFEEITGIDASGKPDKSRFLMALGLNLMQNKAGKDFDFSKIVDEGAKSVEKAMPFLDKAVAKAEAASLSAGKFALDEIKAGESATAAFNKEVRTNTFNWALKKMELEEKANIEKIKNKGKSNEMKNVASVPIGAGDIKVRIGDIDGVSKFASGPTDAGAIVNAYTKYTEGQGNISIMGDALTAISNKDSSAVSILADRAKSLGVAWGFVDGKDMFGEKGISDEAEFEKYRQATINAFKKLILQESQVSNLDLTTLFASFGEVSFMKNPKEAEAAIDLMNQYFAAKKRSLEPVLANFYDRSWYRSDEDYTRAQEELSKLSGAYKMEATTGEGGRLSLDLTVTD
jgi:hypothetical protein